MGLEALAKGFVGELQTKFILSLFPKSEYRIINNVLIPTDDGTTQVDHVVVSPYGLFVVESKHKNGWIYGSAHQKQWIQNEYGKKYMFQNPLHQNYAHTQSLAAYLDVEHENIHSLVVFWGSCEFKTPMPENVCKGGLLKTDFANYVLSKNKVLLSTADVEGICEKLKEAKENSGLLNQWRHVAALKSRHGAAAKDNETRKSADLPARRSHEAAVEIKHDRRAKLSDPVKRPEPTRQRAQHNDAAKVHSNAAKCPRCGAELVKRVSTRGERQGSVFLGCSSFPKCRYMKDLG